MIKFKLENKGRVTQWYGGNPPNNPDQYKGRSDGHSGIDTQLGWGKPHVFDNPGYIYKVYNQGDLKSNWRGVYQLVHIEGDKYMEVIMGHFCLITLQEGWTVPEGAVAGWEGNKGYVFSGGRQITIEEQNAGVRKGHHLHVAYRPVELARKTEKNEKYLMTKLGTKYRDKKGYYYRIINKDNGYKGCVNPIIFSHKDSIADKLRIAANVLVYIAKYLKR